MNLHYNRVSHDKIVRIARSASSMVRWVPQVREYIQFLGHAAIGTSTTAILGIVTPTKPCTPFTETNMQLFAATNLVNQTFCTAIYTK